ncbi:MAG: hypothetical protein HYX75_16455 [Acidobacteria bacterium]|nr:hypothetical protein [Acidobacteriota bacterium]
MTQIRTFVFSLAWAITICAPVSVRAEQHMVNRLGDPKSCFNRAPLRKPADLRSMLHNKKADVELALQKAGWSGSVEDIDRAAMDPTTVIGETTIQVGATMPYMAMRRGGVPGVIDNVVWAGDEPFGAYTIDFYSTGHRYRLFAPKDCGNFWIEALPDQEPGPAQIQPQGVAVAVTVSGDVCVTQPVDVKVSARNAAPSAQVTLTVGTQPPISGALSAGSFQATLPGFNLPGRYTITALVEGVEGSGTVTVNPCPPTCSLSVTPTEIRRGSPFTIDASGSSVAPGVTVGLRSVSVDILLDGTVVDHFDLTPPSFRRDDVILKKAGSYAIRAVAIDEVGQSSTNPCEAALEVTSAFPLFVAGFVGKERLVREEFGGGHCAPLVGAKLGFLPQLGESVELEASVGGKLDVDDTGNSSLFVDLALNGLMGRGFLGGGVSLWDLTHEETRAASLLIQGGFDITSSGALQLTLEGRIPFDQFDDIENNYQFWGGLRIRRARR